MRHSVTTQKLAPGLTLLELLLVISIVAMLLSIMVPITSRARTAAMKVSCKHNLRQINLAFFYYLTDNNQRYPCAQDPQQGGYWLWMGRWRSFVASYLAGQISEDRSTVLVCPQDIRNQPGYEAFSYAYSMSFYHSNEQINQATSPADAFMIVRPSVPRSSGQVAHPAGKILIGEWYSNHRPVADDQGWWCWAGQRNYLFADGSIAWIDAKQIRPARDGLPDPHLTVDGLAGVDRPASR